MVKKLIGIMIVVLLPFSLAACNPSRVDGMGTFYSLQEAYEERLITKTDLMHIIYFMNGSIFDVEEQVEIPFEPQIEKAAVEDLDSAIRANMKEAFYEIHRQSIDEELDWHITNKHLPVNTSAISTISITSFLGEFNGVFAARVISSLWEYDLGSYSVNLAGMTWEQFAPEIIIYK